MHKKMTIIIKLNRTERIKKDKEKKVNKKAGILITLQMHNFIVASPCHTYLQCQLETKANLSLS